MKWLIAFCVTAMMMASCTSYHPVSATSNTVGTKVGTASQSNILGFIRTGEASIKQAARNGAIRQISTVDQRLDFYFFFWRTTTIVTGN